MPAFLEGGGQVGALMRDHDWHGSPLGPPDAWAGPLRTVVALLLDSKFPMFVAWGSELVFLYNDAYAEILGAKHPAALGARFEDIWAEIWTEIQPLVAAAMAGRATYRENLPLTMNRKGFDEKTWFTFSYSPVRDERGHVAGMFCAVAETTRQVLAERDLKAAQQATESLNATLERRIEQALAERRLLADIVENTDTFVQVVDMDFRWLAINKAAATEFERIFGVRPRVGDDMRAVLGHLPGHRLEVEAIWRRALDGEEFTAIAHFGDTAFARRTYEMKFNVLRDRDGRQVGAYQFVYDVTKRIQDEARLAHAEEHLRHSQKMETIGQLTGGVAHDFNNLLTPIVGAFDLLRRGTPQDARTAAWIDGGLRSAERARLLIQRLLAFSRREPPHPRDVDVRTLVEGMADLLARSLGPHVRLTLDLDDALPPVHVDPNQLELALLNLAVNGRDAMSGRGELRVAARAVARGSAMPKSGSFIAVAVQDDGAGMDAETLRRAVEPFFTTKGVGRGTGLGLSSVQGLAEQAGGLFTLESAEGRGTTATLWLPVNGRAHATPEGESDAAEGAVARATSARVLLVDDEDLVRQTTADMLAAAGFRVTQARTADEALAQLRGGLDVDVLVTDYAMPGTTGVELGRQARALRPALGVLMITGYSTATESETAGLARLAKPFRQREIADAVAALAPRRAARAADAGAPPPGETGR